MWHEHEKGAGTFKAIITLVVVLIIGYAAIKIVPVYVNNYQLQDGMRTEARFAGAERKNEEQIRSDVYTRIQELGIPARKEDILVEPITGSYGSYKISVKYTVLVDFPGYQLKLQFNPQADSNSI